jgi:hypothetical protein
VKLHWAPNLNCIRGTSATNLRLPQHMTLDEELNAANMRCSTGEERRTDGLQRIEIAADMTLPWRLEVGDEAGDVGMVINIVGVPG